MLLRLTLLLAGVADITPHLDGVEAVLALWGDGLWVDGVGYLKLEPTTLGEAYCCMLCPGVVSV